MPWFPYDPSSVRGGVSIPASKIDYWASIGIYLQSVKTRCGFCGEVSPLNLIKAGDLMEGVWSRSEPLLEKNNQAYVFAFRCQSCRRGVEFFMVSRDGAKLTLTGRSPMERVDVPPFIPKKQSRYYSAAIIAFNSGQILPGLFMQRTFIEQCVRDETRMKAEKEVDRVLEQYMTTLHVDFRDRFPSLAAIYSRLSEAIHKADESAELFANSHREIDTHFDAKRLYLLANGNGGPGGGPGGGGGSGPPPNGD